MTNNNIITYEKELGMELGRLLAQLKFEMCSSGSVNWNPR